LGRFKYVSRYHRYSSGAFLIPKIGTCATEAVVLAGRVYNEAVLRGWTDSTYQASSYPRLYPVSFPTRCRPQRRKSKEYSSCAMMHAKSSCSTVMVQPLRTSLYVLGGQWPMCTFLDMETLLEILLSGVELSVANLSLQSPSPHRLDTKYLRSSRQDHGGPTRRLYQLCLLLRAGKC
jgi:hypothetical protein